MEDPTNRKTISTVAHDLEVDAGEEGCGDLVIRLNKAMRTLKLGQVIKVHAYDPAAYIDLPAWCRMRGHQFLEGPNGSAKSPFFIRKGDK